jgi:hypothetical protein
MYFKMNLSKIIKIILGWLTKEDVHCGKGKNIQG